MAGALERARGHWPEILSQLGVAPQFLRNRKGPCPACGGRDRFRFDDRGEGWHYCNQCGPGTGIVLLRKLHKWDHKTACEEIERVLGAAKPQPMAVSTRAPRSDKTRAADLDRLLGEATDPSVVARFLASRSLAVSSPVLRGHPACPFYDDGRLVARYPAVLAPIVAPDGHLASVQRLYLTDAVPPAERKKTMPPVGTITGAAVRLHEPTDELGLAEGVATALAAMELFGVPTWSAGSDNGIATFVPPPGLDLGRLHVFGDNDRSYAGQAAAYSLGKRLAGALEVVVTIPDEPDIDWADVLCRSKQP